MPELRHGPLGERLVQLKSDLVEQGRHVQRIVEAAVQSIFEKDRSLAEKVVKEDEVIDRVDIRIERAAVALLTESMQLCAVGGASAEPPLNAYQIRMILTIVKVNNEFERIADLAVAMVTRMSAWLKLPGDPPRRFRVMANSVIGMIEHSIMSLDQMDTDAARLVLTSDDATEAFREAILRENEEELAGGNRSAEYAFALNRVAAAIARMADHCTNVAEQVIYVETGKIVRHTDEHWTEPSEPDFDDENWEAPRMSGTTTTTPNLDDLRARLAEIEQDHLLRFADELSPAQAEGLCAQIASLDLDSVPALVREYVLSKPSFDPGSATIAPPPGYMRDGDWDIESFRSAGERLLREGKVAAFTVAGGQGSRLGYDGPKGCYPGGAVTGKPLFACLADWIHAAQDRYGATVPWYIMTSPLNHEATVAFFKEHDHFGLSPDNIMFFAQGVLPSFDMTTGKILLAAKGEVATNPDGHGGSLRALAQSGALEDMKRRAVEHISYVQIDNPLARVVDPVFIGLHATAPDSSGEMSTKVVAKTEPGEKVGVVCTIDGKPGVIEYSDLPEATAAQRNPDGTLTLRAGNIALHMLSRSFVERVTSGDLALPYHRAEKKVPHVDLETGEPVDPSQPNAVKLEMFVFDAIPLCQQSIVYEVERTDEFAPIKNAEGNDSPESSARLQTERAASWLEVRGVTVPRKPDGSPDCVLEISPRTATQPEELDPSRIDPIKPGEKRAI